MLPYDDPEDFSTIIDSKKLTLPTETLKSIRQIRLECKIRKRDTGRTIAKWMLATLEAPLLPLSNLKDFCTTEEIIGYLSELTNSGLTHCITPDQEKKLLKHYEIKAALDSERKPLEFTKLTEQPKLPPKDLETETKSSSPVTSMEQAGEPHTHASVVVKLQKRFSPIQPTRKPITLSPTAPTIDEIILGVPRTGVPVIVEMQKRFQEICLKLARENFDPSTQPTSRHRTMSYTHCKNMHVSTNVEAVVEATRDMLQYMEADGTILYLRELPCRLGAEAKIAYLEEVSAVLSQYGHAKWIGDDVLEKISRKLRHAHNILLADVGENLDMYLEPLPPPKTALPNPPEKPTLPLLLLNNTDQQNNTAQKAESKNTSPESPTDSQSNSRTSTPENRTPTETAKLGFFANPEPMEICQALSPS